MVSDIQTAPEKVKASDGPLLEALSISKFFGPVQALRDVDFQVRTGEVMALVGENGAGKSTLVKILTGLYAPDSGSIQIAGSTVQIRQSADSQALEIAVVQQELSLVPTMSVAENVFLGARRFGIVYNPRKLEQLASPYLERVGLEHLDPSIPVGTLSVAERHLIEVARAVSREARILILDEPTASLDEGEIERVKRVVHSLAEQGRSVIYVTHRLPEVFDLAHRVTVLRNGESQPGIPVSELTPASLIKRMIGRSLRRMYPPRATDFGTEVLAVHELRTAELRTPVTLSVRSGEILGLAGQIGSGAGDVLNAIAGIQPVVRGRIELKGRALHLRGRRDAILAGIAHCSADRKRDGIFSGRTVTENLTSPALHRVTPGGWLNRKKEKQLAESLGGFFQIDVDRLEYPAGTLSGGNQQKVALGKWLGVEPAVLLVEEPTPGVDVGARADIYAHLRRMAKEGLAVVFASSDIQEVLGLADKIGTFYHRRLINIYAAEEADMNRLTRDVTSPNDPIKTAS